MPLSNEERTEIMDIFRECVQEMKDNGEWADLTYTMNVKEMTINANAENSVIFQSGNPDPGCK